MKTKIINYSIVFLGLVPIMVWTYRYINWDLWYDEVYSLEHFSLQGFKATLFYYPAPNNHIFFNLTSQLISRIFNLRDAFLVSENVYVFRLFQLAISLLSAYYTVLVAKLFFNKKSNLLIYSVFFTTIPIINFSLQLRGYNMSSLFLIMMIYYTWRYIEFKRNHDWLKIFLSTLLLIYTIPSNLYFAASLWLSVVFVFGIDRYFENRFSFRNYRNALVFIALGVIAAMVLYLPVIEDVIFNKYSYSEASGYFYTWGVFKQIIPAFLSNRYLLLLFVIPFVLWLRKNKRNRETYYYIFLLAMFAIPFAISFIHQKAPFQRVFIPLAPVFCLLLALPLIQFIDHYTKGYKARAVQFLVALYCLFVFIGQIDKNEDIISKNLIENNKLSQDISRNFYLAKYYKQDSVMKNLSAIRKDIPVVTFNQLDGPSTDLYLRKYNIPYDKANSVDDIKRMAKELNHFYMLTSTKTQTLKELQSISNIQVKVLNNEVLFTNIIDIRYTGD